MFAAMMASHAAHVPTVVHLMVSGTVHHALSRSHAAPQGQQAQACNPNFRRKLQNKTPLNSQL